MSPLNITQPLGIWSIIATVRWCPIFPKWDIYQSLDEVFFRNPPRFISDQNFHPPWLDGFCEAHGSGGDDWPQLPEPRGGRAQLGAVLHRCVGAHPDAASVAESGVPGGDAGAQPGEKRWLDQGKKGPNGNQKEVGKNAGKSIKISFGSSKLGESEVTWDRDTPGRCPVRSWQTFRPNTTKTRCSRVTLTVASDMLLLT